MVNWHTYFVHIFGNNKRQKISKMLKKQIELLCEMIKKTSFGPRIDMDNSQELMNVNIKAYES